MDTNRDYNNIKKGNAELKDFIQTAGLVDHYQEKFPEPVQTYVHGSKQLNYIFVDPGRVGTIKDIGDPVMHTGAFSDHVYVYVDFKETKLFQGLIYRPVTAHLQDFMVVQKDSKVAFQKS